MKYSVDLSSDLAMPRQIRWEEIFSVLFREDLTQLSEISSTELGQVSLIFLAAIAALYAILSVGPLVCLSVG